MNRKKVISILLTVLNLLLFAVSLFCMIRDRQIVDSIGTGTDIPYRTEQNDLLLELQSGQTIQLRFHQKNVTVYCADDISRREDKLLLISFIRIYAQNTDIAIPRSNSELLGELKLHSLLYNLGFQRNQTGDADIEYSGDPRWYVNFASRLLG